MALEAEDIRQIGEIVRETVDRAQFGGPTVQVVPSDLVYLGQTRYVSEKTGKTYMKQAGRLIELGDIPAPR